MAEGLLNMTEARLNTAITDEEYDAYHSSQ